ncbi:unnamed protein product [Amaranthus hypochondriacus]
MKMNTQKLSSLAVLVLLVFSASQLISTCEAGGLLKSIAEFFKIGKAVADAAFEIFKHQQDNTLSPPNKRNVKKVYCPLFRQLAKDTTQSMQTRKDAANTVIKYCNN